MAETAEAEEGQLPEIVKTVTFHGRKIRVRVPRPEQVMVWQRILNRLSQTSNDIDGKQAIKSLERARRVMDTVLVDEADIEWLDDMMLDQVIGFKEIGEFMVRAAKLLGKEADKKGSARRKKPKESD